MKCSTFRLAKYGENLRTSFDRNVNRIKSTLPIRLPPDAGSVVEDRTKSGTKNRSGNRPLIGSFSGFQERLMNSFPSTFSSSHFKRFSFKFRGLFKLVLVCFQTTCFKRHIKLGTNSDNSTDQKPHNIIFGNVYLS